MILCRVTAQHKTAQSLWQGANLVRYAGQAFVKHEKQNSYFDQLADIWSLVEIIRLLNIATGETSQAITSLTISTFINRQLSTIDNFNQ